MKNEGLSRLLRINYDGSITNYGLKFNDSNKELKMKTWVDYEGSITMDQLRITGCSLMIAIKN